MGDAPYLPPVVRRAGATAGTPAPMPSGADIARLSAEGFRKAARRQRRRSQLAGSLVGLMVVGALAGAGYAGYRYFDDQQHVDTQPGGLQGALGGAIDSVDGLDRYDPLAGVELAGSSSLSQLAADDVLPVFALGIARDLGDADGMRRYSIDIDDLGDLQPSLTSSWLSTLATLPRGTVADAVLPQPGPGELVLGIAQDGDRVLRLAVRADDPPLSIDTTG